VPDAKRYDSKTSKHGGHERRRGVVDWLCGGREDYREFQRRKVSAGYRKRRGLCVWLWIVAGVVMALQPGVQSMVIGGLTAGFLSFALLDET